ncbi:MAG: DNA polymerase III subunit delta' [Anaerolineales bacterium]|nr:DNA polymerase III subunit delta' [Anaerolineales bacterium]
MMGHEWAAKLLRSHVEQKRVRHAYLITGPEGVGKRTLTLRFAQALNCLSPPALGEFCGTCRPCQLISQCAFPDLHIIESEPQDRTVKVDQIRALQRNLSLSPYEGKRRVALLFNFHEATDQASNALLKTLEEPPPQVVILLTASSSDDLLPTIVSRCEILSLRSLPLDQLSRDLIERGEDPDRAMLLAGLSGGRPGVAIKFMDDPTVLEQRMSRLDDLIGLINNNRLGRFAYVEDWDRRLRKKYSKLSERRSECLDILDIWLSFWRDVMLVSYGNSDPPGNPDRVLEINGIVEELSSEEIRKVIGSLMTTINAISRNANIRLALETHMLDLPQ